MARRRKWEQEDSAPVRRSRWAHLRYMLLITLALLVILYGAAQAMARTAGFRDLVGQHLEARLGLPVKIEGSSVNWRFDLTLRNLVTEGTKRANSPGLRVQRIHLAWSIPDLWQGGLGVRGVELDRCVVVFRRDDEGRWAPREFQPLSDTLEPWLQFDLKAAPAAATASADSTNAVEHAGTNQAETAAVSWRDRWSASKTTFALRQGEMTWWNDGSNPQASVKGVEVQVTPLEAPGRALTHLKLAVDQALAQSGDSVRNLRVEVLDVGTQQLVLGFEAERRSAAAESAVPRP